MQLTNKHNLPKVLAKVFAGGNWCPSHERVGVTQLIGPPLLKYLTIKHWDELEEDVIDRFFSVFGSAVHSMIDRAATAPMLKCKSCGEVWEHKAKVVACPTCNETGFDKVVVTAGHMTEVKLEVPIREKLLVGKLDLYDPNSGTIVDWKCTSTWSAVFDHSEWEQQLNIYAWMLRKMGHKTETNLVYTLFRDWKKSETVRNEDYPKIPVMRFEFPMWSDEKCEEFINSRLDDLLVEGMPRPCTPSERWRKPTKWKLHKKGQKKAVRVMDTVEQLQTYADGKNIVLNTSSGYYTKEYLGQDQRCESYCRCAPFCPYKEC